MDRIKLNGPISIPLDLDLDAILGTTDLSGSGLPAAKRENKYRLAALMLHTGSTARSGHYGEEAISDETSENVVAVFRRADEPLLV